MRAILFVLLLSGCVSQPVITYEADRFGVPSPVINGERYELTDDERRKIGQKFVDAYCPA